VYVQQTCCPPTRLDVRSPHVGLLVAGTLLILLVGVGAWFAVRHRPASADATIASTPPSEPTAGTARALPQPAKTQALPPSTPTVTEASSVERLRALVTADPRRAVALAAELDRRFSRSALAEERASLVIDALVTLGDIGQARTRSEEFFARFPRGHFGLHVETLTGVHPRPTTGEDP
jgi:hypothetical protein